MMGDEATTNHFPLLTILKGGEKFHIECITIKNARGTFLSSPFAIIVQ
jgi:hypothetical protein